MIHIENKIITSTTAIPACPTVNLKPKTAGCPGWGVPVESGGGRVMNRSRLSVGLAVKVADGVSVGVGDWLGVIVGEGVLLGVNVGDGVQVG